MGYVSWSYRASSNLQAIHDYIASDSGSLFYAKRFVRSLVQATRRLETFPRSGRKVPELESFGFREVIHRGYRIIYRIQEPDNEIEILAVVHGARDLGRAMEEDWEM